MKVAIVGAGPGDPDLITVKGRRLLSEADLVVYAGSLVNPALLDAARPGIPIYDSSSMTLDEILSLYRERRQMDGLIVRLHTGDPAMYGAIQEQIDFCIDNDIPVEVVPGVSSVFASAAALQRELTLPGVSQTVILSRISGRTSVPEAERLSDLARHGATLALFLSTAHISRVVSELSASYGPDTPVRVVHRASWPDQRIIAGTLADIADKAEAEAISGQAMILVGAVLDSRSYERSKLYDADFSHGRRKGASSR